MRNLLVFILLTFSCVSTTTFPPLQTDRSRDSFTARAANGMVSSGHPLASRAAADILRKGGNAMDAAIAASFVISVVRPHSTGIGGGGFLLYFDNSTRLTKVFDFRERAPAAATRNMYLDKKGQPRDFFYRGKRIKNASVNGHLSAGVPGLVAGLIDSHRRYGKLSFSQLVQPAIDVANKGFPIYPSLAQALEKRQEVLQNFEGTRNVLFRQGRILKLGETLVQKDLAKTLSLIQKKGKDGFYKGLVARRVIQEMKRGKGLISYADLRGYRTKMREPVAGSYRGYRVVSMPPPSSGGIHVLQILSMLEHYDIKKIGHNSEEGLHIMAEAMRRAFADRAKYLGDPDFVKVPIKGLLSHAYNKQRASSINLKKATPSTLIGAGDPLAYESRSTTHLSVVDKWGNAVSSTQTINYSFGSGVIVQGTGVLLNDEMDDFSKKPGVRNAFGLVGSKANSIAAKKTMLSSMSPTLVFGPQGQLKMVLGSPGGPRILTATLQTIVNHIDHGMSLADAVHAYRIHHQWLPDQIYMEPGGLSDGVISGLRAKGHKLQATQSLGNVSAIMRVDDEWVGVSDTRREGQPEGY